MAAELVHTHLEGHPGARGRSLEHQGHAAVCERARGRAVGLQLECAVEQGAELVARKLLTGQEMASHQGIVVAHPPHGFEGKDGLRLHISDHVPVMRPSSMR